MKNTFHFVRLPVSLGELENTLWELPYGEAEKKFHILTSDPNKVNCAQCLARLGITPAGARMVDADGREVSL